MEQKIREAYEKFGKSKGITFLRIEFRDDPNIYGEARELQSTGDKHADAILKKKDGKIFLITFTNLKTIEEIEARFQEGLKENGIE